MLRANFDSLNGSPFNLKLDTGLGKQGKISADGVVNALEVEAPPDGDKLPAPA